MQTFPRIAATALAAALVLAFAGCKPGEGGAAKPDAKSAAEAAAKPDKDAVPGLPTEKDRNSYMVGMALARQFEPMKDEIDVDVVVKALKTSLAGGKFSILGSTIGALLIATLNKTVLFLGIPAAATPAFKALVIIVLVLLQSERIRSFAFGRGKSSGTPTGPAAPPPTESIPVSKEVVA